MIIAIEGPSAAGKTTWCRAHCPYPWVEEAPYHIAAPDLYADPAEVGRFWVNHNSGNWQRALELEREHGIAVCDGDPFHLYFSWALWRSGALESKLFDIECRLYREAFERQQMGFVDLVLWLEAPTGELRRRAKGDSVRKRKRHEIYLALVPWMKQWFDARERLLPGSVRPLNSDARLEELAVEPSSHRYDVALTDAMLDQLKSILREALVKSSF